jgi:hypothetical protein
MEGGEMTRQETSVGEQLTAIGRHHNQLNVRMSRELITLLSEQLYQSPSKAIEELVINSFDADAQQCHVLIPIASAGTSVGRLPLISVYDDGVGMNAEGLTDLWSIGSSNKRTAAIAALRKRRQIGKFGIGKLATYSLANRITYLTSSANNEILALSLSFDEFKSDPTGPETPVRLEVRSISKEDALHIPLVVEAITASGLQAEEALDPGNSWTLVLLEDLKNQAATLPLGRLKWVLRTAMPLSIQFKLFLNGEEIVSSKQDYETIANFTAADLPVARINALNERTGQTWRIETRPAPDRLGEGAPEQKALVSELFEDGIFAHVIVTEKSLYGGKSEDLTRSYGFFVRVRGRLINEADPLFGLSPQPHIIFNRFRADIDADDLDDDLTAPREGVGLGERREIVIEVLLEILREARQQYERWSREQARPQENKREEDRNYVDPRNVERPVADVLSEEELTGVRGGDADDDWFYLKVPERDELSDVITRLYSVSSRTPYEYDIESLGRSGRIVRFIPSESKFILNEDHDVVIAFQDDGRSRDLLYDLVTAEALLEVYLRETGMSPHIIGEVLERRDILLRSLAREQVTSVSAIADNLRNAVSSERDLEVALVVAARALGFVAKHMSGATNPDGLARLRDYPQGERKITLEAKSSVKVPSLSAIDFAGLARHVKEQEAQGCLLIAPDYPGDTKGSESAAAKSADAQQISCWTVEQLARVVESMESRHITARQVLDIVLSTFKPDDVAARVAALLHADSPPPQRLAQGVIDALRSLEQFGPPDRLRSIDMILVELARAGLAAPASEVRSAMAAISAASQGAVTLTSGDNFRLNTSVEELERRVAPLTGGIASARRASTFRAEQRRPDVS